MTRLTSTWYPIDIEDAMPIGRFAGPIQKAWVFEYPGPRATPISILSGHFLVEIVVWGLEPLLDIGKPPFVAFELLVTDSLSRLLL